MSGLLGHDDAWREWNAATVGTRMPHAWILAGKRGLGKAAFALQAAARLVREDGAPQPDPMAHPDIVTLAPLPANEDEEKKRAEGKPWQAKRNISVDQIRQMQQRLVTRPTLGARRVILVDCADDLEKSAVNALLKSLEEPPVGTFFLLVSHRPGRLLPTVRSRCRMLRFAPIDQAAMEEVLRELAPQANADSRAAAIAAAAGSPGAALRYVEQDLGSLYRLACQLVQEGDPSFVLRGELSAAIGTRPDRERLLAACDLARAALVDTLPKTQQATQARIIEAHAALNRLAAQVPTANFDPALLVMEIGGLLAMVAAPRELAN